MLDKFNDLIPIPREDKSSPAQYYKLPGAKGLIGLINPISSQFCNNCNRLRLTADGKIKPCLHSDQEIDIKKIIKTGGNLDQIIQKAIWVKPQEHQLNNGGKALEGHDENRRIGG